MNKKIMMSFLVSLLAVTAQAAPKSFRFQGRLTDNKGSPFAGSPKVLFEIFDSPTGGKYLWQSTDLQTVNANSIGLFSTDIGPVPADIFATTADLYLQISVRDVGINQVLQPRQKLSYVPYAIQADRAESAGFAESIKDKSVTSLKIADGAVREVSISSNAVTSMHIKNYSVLAEDLGLNVISSTNIVDGSITEDDLKEGSVTTDQIQDGTVSVDDLNPSLRASFIPSGMIMMSTSACPLGWSRFAALDGRFPMGTEIYSGIPAGTTTISGLNVQPSGAETLTIPGHSHGAGTLKAHITPNQAYKGGAGSSKVYVLGNDTYELNVTGQTDSNGNSNISVSNHTHAIDPMNWTPPNLGIIFCQKD